MFAAARSHLETVAHLLSHPQIKIHLVDTDNESAWIVAARQGHSNISEMIEKEISRRLRAHRQIRLRTFLLGTHRCVGGASVVRYLPRDLVGLIATVVIAETVQDAELLAI
eukprot:c19971_g1_i2.p2 GENE.c19971_g1_i2~~c19971_g1_i2.p2  ORF type:complete len:111 (+),score=17.57 c19971_g1_i2:486-818(+)